MFTFKIIYTLFFIYIKTYNYYYYKSKCFYTLWLIVKSTICPAFTHLDASTSTWEGRDFSPRRLAVEFHSAWFWDSPSPQRAGCEAGEPTTITADVVKVTHSHFLQIMHSLSWMIWNPYNQKITYLKRLTSQNMYLPC